MGIRQIDLNADLGEGFGPWSMGQDEAMLPLVSSANVACGGHAGDTETMFRTLSLAVDHDVAVGAHPSYPDKEGFGRRVIPMPHDQIGRMVAAQIGALQAVAAMVPTRVRYVKAHGALANLAARDRDVALVLVEAVQAIDADLAVLAISGTQIERAARDVGVPVYAEVFADRGYQASGQLVPRGQAGDLIRDPVEAADRLVQFLETGHMPVVDGDPIPLAADSVCVHGDSPGAVGMTRLIRSTLMDAEVDVASFTTTPL